MTSISVDLSIYPLDVVLRAAHAFTARYGVLARRDGEARVLLEFTSREGDDDRNLAAAFSNALLDAQLRARIAAETRAIRELLVAQAFCEADLLDRRDSECDESEDPRGIGR